MTAASGAELQSCVSMAGPSVMDLLLQLQADQLGVPIRRPATLETTALGAAYLAGLSVGVWGSLDEIADHWELDVEVKPAGPSRRRPAYAQWQRAVERSRSWAQDDREGLTEPLHVSSAGASRLVSVDLSWRIAWAVRCSFSISAKRM